MTELPAGRVTFLFTDIEGSTRLLDDVGEVRYEELLGVHRTALRDAFSRHGGVEVDTQGDAFFYVFEDAGSALRAAGEGQAVLADGPVAVRMGAHTGAARRGESGYVGREVHRAARIAASGHGGQVVVSSATAALADLELTELGEHRLKDFDEPIPLFQLGTDDFPPLKTVSNTNLPRPASSFVGREQEVADVAALLRNGSRLVTLTGPGGSGKTRLGIESAAELVGDFGAGVFWVPLATVRESGLVLDTIAQTLGAKEALQAYIGERELLLLLDNLEQVIDAAPDVAALVEACANLRLLVTSRTLLRVGGEIEYEVLPLPEPDALELFCARAGIDPSPAAEEVCRRLDNLPLALELAAARARLLTPEQILDRLAQRLDLLKGGRDADPRQATLRATIEWSHDLLDESEGTLFRRIGVFDGGCTLEAAEDVAGADLDTLQSLVEKSLVRRTDDRFWMLETIREFALERLDSSDDVHTTRERHLAWLVSFVCDIEPRVRTAEQEHWLDQLEPERANIRAALDYARSSGAGADELRIAVALRDFWNFRGPIAEAQRWLEEAAAGAGEELAELRAEALHAASYHAFKGGDFVRARELGMEVFDLARTRGDRRLEIWALTSLGGASEGERDFAQARQHFDGALALARELGEPRPTAVSLLNRGDLALLEGDYELAVELSRESLAAAEPIGDVHVTATGLANLTLAQLQLRDMAGAESSVRELLQLPGLAKDVDGISNILLLAAAIAERRGAALRAGQLLGASDAAREEIGLALEPVEQELYDATVASLVASFGAQALDAALGEGRQLGLEEAIELCNASP
jgi:predicted ATPase